MADVFLYVDALLSYKLLIPEKDSHDTKATLAAREAVKLKAMMGSLRALWRSTPTNGLNNKITELKGYLVASPTRSSQALPEPSPEDDQEGGDENGEGEVGVEGENGNSENCEDVEEEIGEGEEESEMEQDEPLPIEDEVGSTQVSEESGEGAPTHRTLSASTLELGKDTSTRAESVECSESEDFPESVSSSPSVDMRDSQVSSGWQGKAIMWENETQRQKEAEVKEKNRLEKMVQDILIGLDKHVDGGLFETPLGDAYGTWCLNALKHYGDGVFGMLATEENFNSWRTKDCCC